MPSFTDKIANAIRINGLFRDRKDGCIETAVAALGGSVEKISFLAQLKIEGRLTAPVNENLVEFAGLTIRRSHNIGEDKGRAAATVEEALNDSQNAGVLVVYDGLEIGHATAIIHRRNYPGNIKTEGHVVVDKREGGETLGIDTVERVLRSRPGLEPKKVLVIGNKKS